MSSWANLSGELRRNAVGQQRTTAGLQRTTVGLQRTTAGLQRTTAGLLVVWALLAIACGGGTEPELLDTGGDPRRELNLLTVGSFPRAAISEMGPLVRWLNEHLAADGLRIGVQVATSVPEAASWLRSGKADFYLDSPQPMLLARHLSGCRPILRRWKFGRPTYHSVLFTRADSGIMDLEDLRGRTIAFEDRYSSSSFFLPVDFLFSHGLDGVFLGAATDPVPADGPGFVFSGGDSNTMHWVLAGKVAAGAMNAWNVEKLSGDERDALRVLATTAEIPRHLLAVRADLEPAIEDTVRGLLVSAHESASGRAMLEVFSSTDRFDDLPPEFTAEMDQVQDRIVRLDDRLRAALGEDP